MVSITEVGKLRPAEPLQSFLQRSKKEGCQLDLLIKRSDPTLASMLACPLREVGPFGASLSISSCTNLHILHIFAANSP